MIRSFFFFQAEDGIRDRNVTGVQTCALPIFGLLGEAAGCDRRGEQLGELRLHVAEVDAILRALGARERRAHGGEEIGRASCRERGGRAGGGVWVVYRERV